MDAGRGAVTLYTQADGHFEARGVPLGTFDLRVRDPLTAGLALVPAQRLDVNGQVLNVGQIALDDTDVVFVSADPADGAVNVPTNHVVRVQFSDPLASPAGVVLMNGDAPIPLAGKLSDDRRVVTFEGTLPHSRELTIAASTAVTDVFGRHLAEAVTSRFTTVDLSPPFVVAVTPPPSAIQVQSNAVVTVVFSEALSQSTDLDGLIQLNAAGTSAPGSTALTSTTMAAFTPSQPLAINTLYSVTVNGAIDAAGNQQAAPFTSTFSTLDTVQPVLTLIQPQAGAWVKDRRPAIEIGFADNLTGLDPSSAALTVDGIPVTLTQVGSSLRGTPASDLPEGGHALLASAADRAGNPANLPAEFSTDTILPSPALVIGTTEGQVLKGTVTLSGSATDAGSGVERIEIFVDGALVATTTSPAFSAPVDTTVLTEGAHTFGARATDRAGNVGATGPPVHVFVDNHVMTLTITAPAEGAIVRGPITVKATTSEATSRVEFRAGTELSTDGIAPFEGTLSLSGGPEGPVTITVTAFAEDGAIVEATRHVVVDRTPPSAPDGTRIFAEPPDGSFSFVFGQPGAVEVGTTVEVTNTNNSAVRTAATASDGSFALTIEAAVDNLLSVVAIDGVGNRSTATTTVVRTETSLPPVPATLRFEGVLLDRVGSGTADLEPDGDPDAVFTMTFSFGSNVTRQLAYVDLQGPVMRSTRPEAGSILGVAADLAAPLKNAPTGQVNFSITSSGTLVLFAAREDFLQPGTSYTATAVFTNGSRYVGTFTTAELSSHEAVGPVFAVVNVVVPDPEATGAKETVGPTFSVANVTLPDDTATDPKETVGAVFSVANLQLPDPTATDPKEAVGPLVSVRNIHGTHVLTSITVAPSSATFIGAGQTLSLVVTGHFSDETQEVLTSGVAFTSSNPAVAAVNPAGLVTSGNNGVATITVSAEGVAAVPVAVTVKSLVTITLSPPAFTLIAVGATQSVTVTGIYSDGSTIPLISGVTLSSSDISVATVSAEGVVTSVGAGLSTITAVLGALPPAQSVVTVALACLPVPSGLVSWWPGDGDATDRAGGNVGTLQNGASFGIGTVGQGFGFNGAGFVSIPSAANLNLSALTLDAWISMDSLLSTADFVIVSKGITSSSENYGLYVRPSGTGTADLLFEWFNGGFRQVQSSGSVLTAGVFHHVAVTVDGTNVTFYVDGQVAGHSVQSAPLLPNSLPLQIGSNEPFYGNRFDGVIDELSLYNRALTADEVAGLFLVGSAGKCAPTGTPVISSITPRVIDAKRPPSSIDVRGTNLGGATFSLVPVSAPAAVASGASQTNTGLAATLPLTVSGTAHGKFTLVGTNSFGTGDAAAAHGNTLVVINDQDDVDSDSDGFADGLELLSGSDPLNSASVPDLAARGELSSGAISVANNIIAPATLQEALSGAVSILNTAVTSATPQELVSPSVSILNTVRTSPIPEELLSPAVSISNGQFASTTSRELLSASVSVSNSAVGSTTQTVIAPAVSILNSDAEIPSAAQLTLTPSVAQELTVRLTQPDDGSQLVEGQTITVRAVIAGAQGSAGVEFSVNGQALSTDSASPYELTFSVPFGVGSLAFGATAKDASGREATAAPVTVVARPDPSTTITGRVVDAAGNPIQGAVVELLSEGLQAEFFKFTEPLVTLPDLSGRTSDEVRRVTAINMRNPNGIFGFDPLGSRLAPDYAARFTGWIPITVAGTHRFFLGAHQGARLKIAGVTVVEIPASAGSFQEASGVINLSTGMVPIEVTYFEGAGHAALELSLTPPGGERQVVPPSSLVPGSKPFVTTTDASGAFVLGGVPTALEGVQVRATITVNNQNGSGTSRRVAPVPDSAVDVGSIVIVMGPR